MAVSFDPVYDEKTKVLILGSFPSVKSREVSFYYGHPKNRFWYVCEEIFGYEGQYDTLACAPVEEKHKFLKKNRIALWDVVHTCDIHASSDASIKNVIANDISELLLNTDIKAIYCNGKTSYNLYKKHIYPITKIHAVCLPSTSPANAAWSFAELTGAWKRILITLGRTDFSQRYYSLNSYAKDNYEKKLYKLSLNGGFTCPNRDGKIDTRGCIFCDGEGSGHFAGGPSAYTDISEQIECQKQLIKSKLPQNTRIGYIAYFQSFTGTYAPVDVLEKKYMEAINNKEVDIISIATRPDCLDRDVIELLKRMNRIKPVWIELGLQTIHPATADYIRRGYDLKVYDSAVRSLLEAGIEHIITHIIIGLPGETQKQILDSVSYVCESGAQGIKLQLLHVIEGTDLADDYIDGKFDVLTMDEYIEILNQCFDIMPVDMVVHRLSGDGSKHNLIAPLWSADKKRVLNAINSISRLPGDK